ncbi:MAG: MATE family efflux transporter [Candidatus Gastranaerophilaceae bacterium]|jgi:putative MATE family efflux protein
MRIQLSDHFTYKRLLRFVMPSIVMMIFTSIYGVVDGLFVSNFVGKTPFAAINLIMPLLMGLGTIGFMIGTGGSALVSKTLGEGQPKKANQYFSMLICMTVISGIVLTAIGLFAIRPVALAMGATGELLENCVVYGSIMLTFQTAFMLQNVFQSLFAVAEKPKLGLMITVAAGMTNILLDALFIAVFRWGLAGAAIATAVSQIVGGIIPIIYFARHNSSLLSLTKPVFSVKTILKVCTNGSSELMTNLSNSVIGVLYNLQLMKIAGENGIAAYGVIMYVNFIFNAIFFGYAIGSAPVVGYHYGAENYSELKNLFRKSLTFIGICGVSLTGLALLLAAPLSKIFVGYDVALFEMTAHGFRLFALSFLIGGFNIFSSAFFTALNNGFVSATISFARTFLFQSIMVVFLPLVLGIDGIWLAIGVAELLALSVTALFFIKKKKRYQYA